MPESRHPHPSLPVNLVHKAALIEQQWSPRVVAEMNDYQFKVVRIEGEFIWHAHPETDEAFLVLEGTLRIDLPDGCVHVNPGELYVVPRGVEHRTAAQGEAKLMMIEPRGILNTGHEGGIAQHRAMSGFNNIHHFQAEVSNFTAIINHKQSPYCDL